MSESTPKDWRELCRKAAEELDPDKFMDLIVEINKALDEHARKHKGVLDKLSDSDMETEAVSFGVMSPTRRLTWQNALVQFHSLPLAQGLKSA